MDLCKVSFPEFHGVLGGVIEQVICLCLKSCKKRVVQRLRKSTESGCYIFFLPVEHYL